MTTPDDARPLLAIGHVLLRVTDIAGAAEYFRKIGMRVVETTDEVAVLELRGGTHVVLLPAEGAIEPGTSAPFDLMVDDLESVRTDWKANGMRPSDIEHGSLHDTFQITGPDGYEFTVYSSHASGLPV